MKSMRKCNLIISLVSIVLGIAIVYFSWQLGMGPSKKYGIKSGTWPGVMGILMIVCALILLITTLIDKGGKLKAMEVALTLPANMRVYVTMGVMIVFCVLLKYLGLYISGAVMMPVVMLLLGEKKLLNIGLVTVCTLVGIYLVFGVVLKTSLPEPFWA